MTWAEFFSSQLFGVIIGALLTGGFTWVLDLLRDKREYQIKFKEKRQETYLLAIDALLEYSMYVQNNLTELVPKGIQKLNSLQAYIGLYASGKISDEYYKIIEQIRTIRDKESIRLQIVKFTKNIKQELGIKDV